MTSPEEPNCYKRKCRWLIGVKPQPAGRLHSLIVYCQAFPDMEGIPTDILYGEDKHETVREGQTGEFVYQQKENGNE